MTNRFSFRAGPSWACFCLALLLVLALAGCAPAASPAPAPVAATPAPAVASPVAAAPTSVPAAVPPTVVPAVTYPLTVTDSAGRTLTLQAAPRRIVSLSPGGTEVLAAIGAGPQMVGVDTFSDYPADLVASLPKVAYSNPDLEQIVALQPDLVIVATRQRAQLEDMVRLGLPAFLREEPASVAGVADDMRFLGRLVGRPAEAESVAARYEQEIGDVVARVASVTEGPRVFYEISARLHTASDRTFVGDQLTLLKARNVAAGAPQAFPQMSPEALLAANPQVILLADAPPTGEETRESVSARPGWQVMDAVRDGRIVPVDGNLATRPGPRVPQALEIIGRALYPDLFPAR